MAPRTAGRRARIAPPAGGTITTGSARNAAPRSIGVNPDPPAGRSPASHGRKTPAGIRTGRRGQRLAAPPPPGPGLSDHQERRR
jgi:hypothetical protein